MTEANSVEGKWLTVETSFEDTPVGDLVGPNFEADKWAAILWVAVALNIAVGNRYYKARFFNYCTPSKTPGKMKFTFGCDYMLLKGEK